MRGLNRAHAPHSVVLAAVLLAGGCGIESDLTRLTPQLNASSDSLQFGDVHLGAFADREVVLENVGTGTLPIDGAALAAPFSIVAPLPLPDALSAGQRVVLNVRFSPASAGDVGGMRIFSAGDGATSEKHIALIARGLEAPSCDDDSTCTDDAFDPLSGLCSHQARAGSCNDHSACTVEDRCAEGECVGSAVVCTEPDVWCRESICDADLGCLIVERQGACADNDPCTLDSCGDDGCVHETAPNGTICGQVGRCDVIALCMSGACIPYPVPEGAPCNDGDACSLNETCIAGTCGGGVELSTEPTVVDELRSWGATGAIAAILSPERMVFLDQNPWSSAVPPEAWLTIVDVVGDELVPGEPLVIESINTAQALTSLGSDGVSLLADGIVRVFTVVDEGGRPTVELRGSLDLFSASTQPWTFHATAFSAFSPSGQMENGIAVCYADGPFTTPVVALISTVNLDAPTITRWIPIPLTCTSLAFTSTPPALWAAHSADNTGNPLMRLDLASAPGAEVIRPMTPPGRLLDVSAVGELVALLTESQAPGDSVLSLFRADPWELVHTEQLDQFVSDVELAEGVAWFSGQTQTCALSIDSSGVIQSPKRCVSSGDGTYSLTATANLMTRAGTGLVTRGFAGDFASLLGQGEGAVGVLAELNDQWVSLASSSVMRASRVSSDLRWTGAGVHLEAPSTFFSVGSENHLVSPAATSWFGWSNFAGTNAWSIVDADGVHTGQSFAADPGPFITSSTLLAGGRGNEIYLVPSFADAASSGDGVPVIVPNDVSHGAIALGAGCGSSRPIAFSEDRHRLLAVCDRLSDGLPTISVLDVADPLHPSLAAEGFPAAAPEDEVGMPYSPSAAGIEGNRVILAEAMWGYGIYSTRISAYSVTAGSLQPRGSIVWGAGERSPRVLWFDGEAAIVTVSTWDRGDELVFIDASAETPVLVGSIPLAEPLSAIPSGDRFLVSTSGSIVDVAPPCGWRH